MNDKDHDKLSMRLAIILTKLNLGERFTVDELIEEFGVSKRTIQRDLQERFSYLPIEQHNGQYYLNPQYVGKLSFDDIRSFATLSGIKELYPTLGDNFLAKLIGNKYNDIHLVRGFKYEKLSHSQSLDFEKLEEAIEKQHTIYFIYHDKQREVNPYRLINTQGIWYLIGDEGGDLKTFTFVKMVKLKVSTTNFKSNNQFIQLIKQNKNTWFSKQEIEVTLHVDSDVAEYFLRRELVPHQKVLQRSDNGLEIYTKVAYDEEILSVVKYWIPHIKILSPLYLEEKLEKTLKTYLS